MTDDNLAARPAAETAGGAGGTLDEAVVDSQRPEEQPTLLEQMGGLSGLVSSTLPILVLVPVNNAYGLVPALLAALGVALLIFLWRLVRRENLQPAFSGLLGVGIGAAIAWWTGDAKGYFLYGIWMSLLLFILAVVSVVVRWPLVGVIWRGINGDGMAWRVNPAARRAYAWATLGWAVVFLSRFLIQNNFYNADDTNALALARILMGWPLTGLVTLFTIFMVRRANKAMRADGSDDVDSVAGSGGGDVMHGPDHINPTKDVDRTDHHDHTADAGEAGGPQAGPGTGSVSGQENRP